MRRRVEYRQVSRRARRHILVAVAVLTLQRPGIDTVAEVDYHL